MKLFDVLYLLAKFYLKLKGIYKNYGKPNIFSLNYELFALAIFLAACACSVQWCVRLTVLLTTPSCEGLTSQFNLLSTSKGIFSVRKEIRGTLQQLMRSYSSSRCGDPIGKEKTWNRCRIHSSQLRS